MSFFRTKTPTYKGQPDSPPARGLNWPQWLLDLFQTPTPAYRDAPAPQQTSTGSRDPER